MSAKKVSPKKTATAKKAVAKVVPKKAKKTAPAFAKKAAPAKKNEATKKVTNTKKQVVKTPSKKTVSVKKAASAKKAAAKVIVAKTVAKKKAVEVKVLDKKKKIPIVAVKKTVSVKKVASTKKQPSKQKGAVKAVVKSSATKKTTKKSVKEELGSKKVKDTNKNKVSKKSSSTVSKMPVKKEVKKNKEIKKTKSVKEELAHELSKAKNEKVSKSTRKEVEVPEVVATKLLPVGKKTTKIALFFEIDEQEDRLNKKKVSAEMKGLEKPTAAMRRKASLAEETPEELYQRVIQELEEKNQSFYREAASQVCTKCCVNIVSPEFRVDKDLGYCEDCAILLGLGFTKEARKVDYQMGLMGGDSLDEEQEDEDIDEKSPSLDELEDEEFDLEE